MVDLDWLRRLHALALEIYTRCHRRRAIVRALRSEVGPLTDELHWLEDKHARFQQLGDRARLEAASEQLEYVEQALAQHFDDIHFYTQMLSEAEEEQALETAALFWHHHERARSQGVPVEDLTLPDLFGVPPAAAEAAEQELAEHRLERELADPSAFDAAAFRTRLLRGE